MSKKAALVTGASSGFGLLATVALAKAGFAAIGTMRNLDRRERLETEARERGVAVRLERLDVTDGASIAACVEKVEREVGPIEVLVNNAGFGTAAYLEDLELDEIRAVMETNFFGLVAVTKAVLPLMRARGRGRIVNVSSIAGRVPVALLSAYTASKFAVEGLSESLQMEVRPLGIDVVLIEPGAYKTDIFERNRKDAKRWNDPSSPFFEKYRRFEAMVRKRLEKMADPSEVADAIVHAATASRPRLRYVLGRDAKLELLAKRVLPERVFEKLVRRGMGLG